MKFKLPFSGFFSRKPAVKARYEAARYSVDRSYLPGLTQDAKDDITSGDRMELIRRSRYFEKNSPLFNQILDLIEQNVVGTGINPTPASSAPAYNKAALSSWNTWCKFADVTSRQHFYTLEGIIVRAMVVDGEIFAFLTAGEFGRPRTQLIEAHRVRSMGKLPPGFEAYTDADGILVDSRGRPQFYCVHNGVSISDNVRAGSVTIIPAASIVHFFEPSRASQYHGIPLCHSGLITQHDLDDLQKFEMLAAKDAASRANFVTTENGEMPDDGSFIGRTTTVTGDNGTDEERKAYYEKAFGAKTVVMKTGDTMNQTTALRPSPAMREFWEYLTKQFCRSIGISYAAVENYNGWGGAALRGAITADNRFYEVRTNVLISGLQQIFEYVMRLSNNEGANGQEVPADWHVVHWQPPRRSTVDIGRESAAVINELRSGLRTYRDTLGEVGLDWEEVLEQRAKEEAKIDELSAKYKVDRSRIAALGPNERPPSVPDTQELEVKPKK